MEYNESSVKDIHKIALKMREVFRDEDENDAVLACIAYAITGYNRDISLDDLIKATQEASEWLSLYVGSIKTPTRKELVN